MKNLVNPFTFLEKTYEMSKQNYEKMEKDMAENMQKASDYWKSQEVSEMMKKYQPMNVWQEYAKNMSKTFEETSKKEEYSKAMGDTLNVFLLQQEMIQKITDNYLKQYNIPTKKDIANVSSLVIQLEEKVDELTDALQRIEGKLEQGPENKSTKK